MSWFSDLFSGAAGEVFGKIGTAILGSIASGVVSQGLNAAFAPKPPSRGDVQRDLQMQAETMANASRPVRTAEQEQADQIAVQQSLDRQATFQKLSKEYNTTQAAGPQTVWDPYEEQRIRQESMAEAAVRGMGESGQAQDWVARRLDEARLKRSTEAQRMYETKLSDLRQQMVPYSSVERPGATTMTPVPQASPLPRTVTNPFSASPVDITAMMRPGQPEEQKKREDQKALYGDVAV